MGEHSIASLPSPNRVASGANFSMVVQVLDANNNPIANANVPVTFSLVNGNNQTIGDGGTTAITFNGGTDGNGQVTSIPTSSEAAQ